MPKNSNNKPYVGLETRASTTPNNPPKQAKKTTTKAIYRRQTAQKNQSAMDRLLPSQQKFVSEYLSNGYNATAAYQKAYPNASHATADTDGPSLSRSPRITSAIQEALGNKGYSKADLERKLAECIEAHEGDDDYAEVRNDIMALAKLAGYLIDRQEVTSIPSEHRDAIRSLINRSIPSSSVKHNDGNN